MRTGVELAIIRQPHLTQTLFARIHIAGIGVRTVTDGTGRRAQQTRDCSQPDYPVPSKHAAPRSPTRGHDRPRHEAKGRGIKPSSPPSKANTGPSQYDASRSRNGNGHKQCDGCRPLSQQQIGRRVKYQATAHTQAGTKRHRSTASMAAEASHARAQWRSYADAIFDFGEFLLTDSRYAHQIID